MKALHFGAGNIGRGFIGKLLADSGAELTFADANYQLVDQLNHAQQYRVHVVGLEQKIETVSNILALNANSADVIERITHADLITTAVGPNVLERIADTLAELRGVSAVRLRAATSANALTLLPASAQTNAGR